MHKRTHEMRRPLAAVTGFGEPRPTTRATALRSLGQVVYAVRIGDTVKIGHTRDLSRRLIELKGDEVLAFKPGGRAEEQEIHASLDGHQHHGQEFYYPTRAVMDVVNEMRAALGLQPIAA